jgi:hypothetical protein
MTGPAYWQQIIFWVLALVSAYMAGVGTALWVWLIVSRLENRLEKKADKVDLDALRNRIAQ